VTCQAPGCTRPARTGNQGSRYCEAHYKRLQRGRPLSTPLQESAGRGVTGRSTSEAYWESVLAYGNAESDADFARARELVQKWGRRLFGTPSGRPPKVEQRVAVEAVQRLGIRGAARALNVSRNAVRRALERAGVRKIRTHVRSVHDAGEGEEP
jgi:hypothetical protein